jgi:linoleoyl-CoA desaturase
MIHGFVSTLIGYVIFVAVCGLFIAIIFQLAHVMPDVLFEPVPDEDTQLESFGKHQLATTADFSVDSKVAEFLFGGLNYQVEHHLFPRVSHVHYSAIQKIVEKTAKEHGLEYHSFPTLWEAIHAHLLYLKFIGNAP